MGSNTALALLSLLIAGYGLYTPRRDEQPGPRIGSLSTNDSPKRSRPFVSITDQSRHRTEGRGAPMLRYRFERPQDGSLHGQGDTSSAGWSQARRGSHVPVVTPSRASQRRSHLIVF